MTVKRTNGPCTCAKAAIPSLEGHQSDCPSLYPAQQEPDALTRLVRHIRQAHDIIPAQQGRWREEALSLVSEAREEQRKARNDGVRAAATVCREEGQPALAACVEDLLPQPEDA